MADATRIQLLAMIEASPSGEACVCDLTEPLNLTQPTVSHHLKILVDAGLLTRAKRGTWAWYASSPTISRPYAPSSPSHTERSSSPVGLKDD